MIDKTNVLYKFEKSYHISYNPDYFSCVGSSVNLYRFHNGEFVTKLKGIRQPNASQFTSDQRLVVKTTTGRYHIYNLRSMELMKRLLPPPKKVRGSTTNFFITADNKYIIDSSYVYPTCELMAMEIETGEYTLFPLGYARRIFVFPTEDEAKYYVVALCAETVDAPDVRVRDFYEFTYISGQFKLQKLFSDDQSKIAKADYRANKFAFADYGNKIKIFDVQKAFQDELEHKGTGALYDLKLSKSGRWLALAMSQNVFVYDLRSKECIRNYPVAYGCFVDFLCDDTKLLIGTWENGYFVSL